MSKYVIIDAEAIQQRIEELEKERVLHEKVDIGMFDSIWAAKTSQAIDLLIEVLSLSTPLIPEIEKAWNAAYADALSIDEETYKPLFFKNYISNLKLDI